MRLNSLVVALAFTLSGIALLLPTQAKAQECIEAQAWVEAHAKQLPTQYDEFARFSLAYRKAIFAKLSPEAQSNLWKQHYQQYLETHPNLDKAQVEFIQKLLGVFTPSLFAQGSSVSTVGADLARIKEQATSLFGQTEATLLLATLGPQEQASAAGNKANCSCSTASDYCPILTFCTTGTACSYTPTGCGTGWVYACNGDCFY
ncbi:bacteriocin fulvocin C-related protein [Myxococcus sp. XM-1-1-1]|uniref:bacteriocin fulvocin C-related protein n=1 Tax=Myxococcus TaxID=32 RepID=UPI001CBE2235|nr:MULTISPECIES: bacteriocin fulvocin C-related protein [Myxococcus]MBZ4410297.1 bacteriocin fulvocin C-related protein [Myxococcus sp. XM-1-1-1]BDT37256.1 bacteriocin fulvocin C-related protein [Myxococcus sp. MH1]